MQNELGKISKTRIMMIWLGALVGVIAITGIIMIGLGNDGKMLSLIEENTRTLNNLSESTSDIWVGWPIVAAMFGSLFAKAAYLIFEGYLISNLIVDEFKNRTINQLFSYPIKKSLILWNKILIVLISSFLALFSAQMIILAVIKIVAVMTGYGYEITFGYILSLLLSSIGVSVVGLLPLVIGMINYSTVGTMVASLGVVVFICNAFPGTLAANLINSLPFIFVLSVISLSIIAISISNIVRKDVSIK